MTIGMNSKGIGKRSPLKVYRLWCGKKRYSPWREDIGDLMHLAMRHGLAFPGTGDTCHLGPLTWIEEGHRARAKARTISLGRSKSLG